MQAALPTSKTLTQKRIFLLWLPLAASWLLMAVEMPYISAALARISQAERMIAAFGLAASLSITIESPVISLLSTATALARSRQNYLMLRRFTAHLMVATTALQFLLGWTPLFDLVVKGWLGAPASLHEPVQLGIQLMLPWSAAIAWRRFRQGILIRFGQSNLVGRGTILRLLSSAGSATLLALFTPLPGVAVGALALSAGVVLEALYAHWLSAPLVRAEFGAEAATQQAELSYGELVNFHWPLAASNLLYLFTQPIIAAALARSPNPELSLAAWPVVGGLLFITRAPQMALPEVTIALSDEPGHQAAMRRFGLLVGLGCSLLLFVLSFTPLAESYFRGLIGVSAELAAVARDGARFGLLMPLAMASVTVSRGLLTARRNTRPQAIAMAVELAVLAAAVFAGARLGLPGVPVAAAGLTVALIIEAIQLALVLRRDGPKPDTQPAQAVL
ncbi:MAG: hypothetical protein KIS85_09210 [Anaerolineales bacterium]|nr:hypothetical protein [Anaerolineales bacterium]